MTILQIVHLRQQATDWEFTELRASFPGHAGS